MKNTKTALVLGAGGFIGSHLVKRLKKDGFWVRGSDLKYPEFSKTVADDFVIGDLRDPIFCRHVIDRPFDEVYQLAADMGGAGYIFTGENDETIMANNTKINCNVIEACTNRKQSTRVFYSSSACVYQDGPTSEERVYPANPDSEYGWEKLFSERLYQAYSRKGKIDARIGRYHNIFGPEGTYKGGREKAPAAICRKVAEAVQEVGYGGLTRPGTIELWGNGKQLRSFLYIDECIEGTIRLMRNKSGFEGPVNIGSTEQISIDQLANKIISISGNNTSIKYIDGPVGVNSRNSDNRLIKEKLKWVPKERLDDGLKKTYEWINGLIKS